MNKKLQLKNVFQGILIGLIILFIICLSWYYLYILKPLKESEELQSEVDLFEQHLEEYMRVKQNQQNN